MSVQVKRRRDTAANVAAFTGAPGEIIVDTTNNRLVLQDGATTGGWPAAKLSEVIVNTRRAIADANATVLTTDRLIAYTALTAARTIALPAAASFPTGTILWLIDESGACSAALTLTISANGGDNVDGLSSLTLNGAYMAAGLQSNGSNGWTVVGGTIPNVKHSLVGIGAAPDPNNPLSVYGASALFNGTNFNVTLNKSGPGNTASIIFEDRFSGRAQMGLNGSDNYSFKVSPDGSAWTTAIAIDAATGAVSLGNGRTAVSDMTYTALATDRNIAYTLLSTARTVTLPTAAGYPLGMTLRIFDESGLCSPQNPITVTAVGSDLIDGIVSIDIAIPYGNLAMKSNGANKWTVVGQPSRKVLTANRTYFVSPTGNDGNSGLSSGAAFSTIQHAINLVATLDLSIYNVTIQLADGTYGAGCTVNGPCVGSGIVTINGNPTTPSNVIINTISSNPITVQNGAQLYLSNFELTTTSSFSILVQDGGFVSFANLVFGACGSQQIRSSDNGRITATGPYVITGGGVNHVSCLSCSVVRIQNQSITLTGSPAFTGGFANAQRLGVIFIDGNTFSGAATGPRYNVAENSEIYTKGASSTFLPGNSPGSAATGGIYV